MEKQKEVCECEPKCDTCGKPVEDPWYDNKEIPFLQAPPGLRVCLGWMDHSTSDDPTVDLSDDDLVGIEFGHVVAVRHDINDPVVIYVSEKGYVGNAHDQGTQGIEAMRVFPADTDPDDLKTIVWEVRREIQSIAQARRRNAGPKPVSAG